MVSKWQAIKVCDFDITTPIDVEKCIDNLGGNELLFYTMIEKYEGMGFFQNLE